MPDIIKQLKWWIENETEAGRKSAMEDAACDIDEMRGLIEEIQNSAIAPWSFEYGEDRLWWKSWSERADAVIARTANDHADRERASRDTVGRDVGGFNDA